MACFLIKHFYLLLFPVRPWVEKKFDVDVEIFQESGTEVAQKISPPISVCFNYEYLVEVGFDIWVMSPINRTILLIHNMTAAVMMIAGYTNERRLEEHVDKYGSRSGCQWVTGGFCRRMPNVAAAAAADGSRNYKTVSEAVKAAPTKSSKRYVIRIKAWAYREKVVEVPKKKINLMFVGDGRKSTIITGDRNVKDGSTTFKSACYVY